MPSAEVKAACCGWSVWIMVFMWKPQIGNQLAGILEKVRCPESEVPRADSNRESQRSEVSLPGFPPIKWGMTPEGDQDNLGATGVQ